MQCIIFDRQHRVYATAKSEEATFNCLSRGLGDVYKRQKLDSVAYISAAVSTGVSSTTFT